MEIEKITGGNVRLMIVESEYQKRQAILREHEARMPKKKIPESKLDARTLPFINVISRQRSVVRSVHDITKNAPMIQSDCEEFRRRETVVIGRHDATELTPDHITLVGLSFVTSSISEQDPYLMAWAEFAPFAVSSEAVDHFIENPNDLDNDFFDDDVIRQPVETSMSPVRIRGEASEAILLGKRARRHVLKTITNAVFNSEHNLSIVTAAIETNGLNSNLQANLPDMSADSATFRSE